MTETDTHKRARFKADTRLASRGFVFNIVSRTTSGAVELLRTELRTLHARIAALEAGHIKTLADCYRGTWTSGATHTRGTLVTDRGSLWLCLSDTGARPGETNDWRLIVKAGKDAR